MNSERTQKTTSKVEIGLWSWKWIKDVLEVVAKVVKIEIQSLRLNPRSLYSDAT